MQRCCRDQTPRLTLLCSSLDEPLINHKRSDKHNTHSHARTHTHTHTHPHPHTHTHTHTGTRSRTHTHTLSAATPPLLQPCDPGTCTEQPARCSFGTLSVHFAPCTEQRARSKVHTATNLCLKMSLSGRSSPCGRHT